MGSPVFIQQRLNVSMVSLKWGDLLSTLLPGSVALFAVAPYFPSLNPWFDKLEKGGVVIGVMLLMAAALAGGVLEAITRILWEPYWLMKRCRPVDALRNLEPGNLELYERGVQSSYKYVTFYANFAWATVLLLIRYIISVGWRSAGALILATAIGILLRASHVQWKYFVNYQNKVFGRTKLYVSE